MSRSFTAFCVSMILLIVTVSGCTPKPTSGKGFTLPSGDAEKGKAVFTAHNCQQCHRVSGVEPPPEDGREMNIALGGEVRRISTYGELVTSVINPSHKLARGYGDENQTNDGESKMTNYNDVLTVSELIDLVAFLQSKYSIRPPEITDYPMYY